MLQSEGREGNKQHAQPFSYCTICPFLATSVTKDTTLEGTQYSVFM